MISRNIGCSVTAGRAPVYADPPVHLQQQYLELQTKALEAKVAAGALGFRQTNFRSHGQPVYTNGQRFITPDVDSHAGGAWKMADSVRNLGSKNTRMGTYDRELNRIGN